MKSMAWQATPTPVLDLLPSLLTTKTNRPQHRHIEFAQQMLWRTFNGVTPSLLCTVRHVLWRRNQVTVGLWLKRVGPALLQGAPELFNLCGQWLSSGHQYSVLG